MRKEHGEALVQCQKYDTTGINKTQWYESGDWCATPDAYRLPRRDRQGWQSRGIALFVTEGQECILHSANILPAYNWQQQD